MDKSYQCPICESFSLDSYGSYDICPVCDWEDCIGQRHDPDMVIGANWLTLNQAKTNWKEHGVVMTEKDYEEARADALEMEKNLEPEQKASTTPS